MRIAVLLLVAVVAVTTDAIFISLGGIPRGGYYSTAWSNMYGSSGLGNGAPGMAVSPFGNFRMYPIVPAAGSQSPVPQSSGPTLTSTIKVNGKKMRCVCTPVDETTSTAGDASAAAAQVNPLAGLFGNAFHLAY